MADSIALSRLRYGKERYKNRISAWSQRIARTFTVSTEATAVPAGFVGCGEHTPKDLEPAGYATNLDVIIDLSRSPLAIGLPTALDGTVWIALFAQVLNQRVYRAQFSLNPTTGFAPSMVPSGGAVPGTCIQDGNTFLVQAGQFPALVWGLTIAATGPVAGFQIGNVWVGSIAHGIEV
jgi:hypothetical protein